MKRFIQLFLILIVLGVGAVQAKKVPVIKAANLPHELKKTIAEELSYPDEAEELSLEGEVWLKICLSPDNKLKVIDCSATNQELGNYVKKELTSLYLKEPGCEADQVYFLKVKFDLLNQ